MKKLIIIPTYNEHDNIESLLRKINDLDLDFDILIIDDASPDKTAQLVRELQTQQSNLFLLERSGKLGLGTAYIAGFKWALAHDYDIVVQMDADHSHNPLYLKSFLDRLSQSDFVIGSRNVSGGGVENWPWYRRTLSRSGSLYARLILGQKINDFTGGYNLWTRPVLEAIDLDNIRSEGYSFQIEMKYRAKAKNFRHTEVPIIFTDRTAGQSKLSKKIFLEAITTVPRLRAAKTNWSRIYLTALVLLAGFFLFFNLGGTPIRNWDEGIYTRISQEFLQSPSLTLTLHGENWFEKPPLGFWLQALSIKFFGLNTWAIRLPSSLYLFFAIIFIYLLTKKLFNEHIGFLAATLTLISPGIMHEHLARTGDLDTGLLLGSVLTLYLLQKSLTQKKFFYWTAIVAGLTFMLRGTSGFFILPIIIFYLLLSGNYRQFRERDYLSFASIYLLIVLPWHLYELIKFGSAFWNKYFTEQFFSRITAPLQNHVGDATYYLNYLNETHGVLIVLLGLALLVSLWLVIRNRHHALLLPLFLFILTAIPLELMATKVNWYLITIIPALMMLLAVYLQLSWKNITLLSLSNALMLLYLCFDNKLPAYQLLWPLILIILLVTWAWPRKTFTRAGNRAIFLILIVGVIIVFLQSDYKYITAHTNSTYEQINRYLPNSPKVQIVFYKQASWYNNWVLPEADFYLSLLAGHTLLASDDQKISHYIDNPDFHYFVSSPENLDHLNQIVESSFTFRKISGDNVLLIYKENK